ncbi:MAG: ABC transporter ATP-binding protein [Spirochaetes bacterium]|nr:ABC transporter ATP-binding protein [Spirochaetota bacterium]
MGKVELTNVCKSYIKDKYVIENFNLIIDDGEFCVLLGPSGCGKSTVLRMIAGLEEITGGEIKIDGKTVNQISPKDRDIAMVFQSYALYPHFTVYQNITYPLKIKKVSKEEQDKIVNEVSEILNIKHLLNRYPKELSGGERQRVAIGRAIVRKPKVFLFDEPLSNLDAKLRNSMRSELKLLQKKLNTTFIYVTHDQVEAMTMGTKIVVMNKGKIQQISDPLNLYNNPKNTFVASFIGNPPMNLFKINKLDNKFNFGTFNIKFENILNYENLIVGIRPEKLSFENGEDKNNFFEAKILVIEPLGKEFIYAIEPINNISKHSDFISLISQKYYDIKGDNVKIYFNSNDIKVYDPSSEEIIL